MLAWRLGPHGGGRVAYFARVRYGTRLQTTMGEGAQARRGVLTRLGRGEGHFLLATEKKKSKISWPRASCEALFLRENQPKARNWAMPSHALGVAPVGQHCLIRYKGINTW